MFNPLLTDLTKIKTEDLELKITELMKKFTIAARSGQGGICQQISVVLEAYKSEQHRRYLEANKKLASQNKSFDDIINVDN